MQNAKTPPCIIPHPTTTGWVEVPGSHKPRSPHPSVPVAEEPYKPETTNLGEGGIERPPVVGNPQPKKVKWTAASILSKPQSQSN